MMDGWMDGWGACKKGACCSSGRGFEVEDKQQASEEEVIPGRPVIKCVRVPADSFVFVLLFVLISQASWDF